jgi:ABC-type transport system involved in multi-copper enzyme maturation permease subunit
LAALLEKEWRELVSSRAFWAMLLLTGPLVGVCFIRAVDTYAELSGLDGTVAGVGEAFSPLIGIWAPTFSAFELVAAFLLPFVVIRVVAGDRQSGALKLEQQQAAVSPRARIAAKAAVLLAGWTIASLGAVIALLLWTSYGGHTHVPEVLAVALGHVLNAGLTIALAAAMAALAEHPSTAAILTLAFTVGTWVLSFAAAVHGGLWERLAGYTPPVMVATFQHGLVRADIVLAAATLVAAGLAVAAVWLRTGVASSQRGLESLAVVGAASLLVFASTFVRASWDLSRSRYSSFARADEAALRRIRAPLRLEVHLAPQDPRRYDLERHALSKLRRTMPALTVQYVSSSSTGLFEQASRGYGEIVYDLGGRQAMSRATSAEGVLETIYDLAGVRPPTPSDDDVYRGEPLASPPKGAAFVFYAVWPALVVGAGYLSLRRPA